MIKYKAKYRVKYNADANVRYNAKYKNMKIYFRYCNIMLPNGFKSYRKLTNQNRMQNALLPFIKSNL